MVEVLLHPLTGMPKRCFPSPDGTVMLCNFTVRDGKIWRFAKNTMYLTLPLKRGQKKRWGKREEILIQKEKEPWLGTLGSLSSK